MTPARPLAAAAALGIAGVIAVPAMPAAAAPAPCDRPERYAAQSGAELFRLNKLALRATPDRTSPDRAAPDQAAPNRTEPDQAAPDRAAPDQAAPDRTEPDLDAPAGGASGNAKVAAAQRAGATAQEPTGRSARPAGEGAAGTSQARGEAAQGKGGRAGGSIGNVRIGEARSILAAGATPNAAAVTRMVNSADRSKLSDPLVQEAPPANAGPNRRDTPAAEAGPLLLDTGALTSHAQWTAGMDCGAAFGKVTRAQATLGAAQVAGVATDALVAVPDKSESLSSTALERRGSGARTVASATVAARTIELLEGAMTVKILRPPTLETRMSSMDGGEVSYVPAKLEVSGKGIRTTELDTAGDSMELTFDDEPRAESGLLPKAFRAGAPLPLPAIPGLTWPGTPEGGAAPASGPGTHVKISLGDVRQASSGHSVAARAEAVTIAISEGGPEDRTKPGYGAGAGVVLDLDFGVLESAAIAPEPEGSGVSGAVSGAGGGLPITGPRVDVLALTGLALIVGGVTALVFGVRTRPGSAGRSGPGGPRD